MAQPTVDKIWMDGKMVDWEDCRVHILTHALHYGSGVFEGIRCYATADGPAVFRLTDHMRRLARSAKILRMDIGRTVDERVDATQDVIRVNEVPECYIRPLAFRGYGAMGLNPLPAPVSVSIAVWPWDTYLGEEGMKHGVTMGISSWRQRGINAMPPVAKTTGNYTNSSLAKIEALDHGYDEAIMLNEAGHVCEGTGENIFIVRDGVLMTPPVSDGILDGITRDSIIRMADDFGMVVRERSLVRTDLYLADEVFVSGTAAEVVPVRAVDGREIGEPGPVTTLLQQTYLKAVKGEVPAYEEWLERV
jgi:branched-chain amino acid aminotransferase